MDDGVTIFLLGTTKQNPLPTKDMKAALKKGLGAKLEAILPGSGFAIE
jgi:hypothetical protein